MSIVTARYLSTVPVKATLCRQSTRTDITDHQALHHGVTADRKKLPFRYFVPSQWYRLIRIVVTIYRYVPIPGVGTGRK